MKPNGWYWYRENDREPGYGWQVVEVRAGEVWFVASEMPEPLEDAEVSGEFGPSIAEPEQ